MNSNQMKRSTSDVICCLAILLFLVSLTVQLGDIPAESATYPTVLIIVSYIMTGGLLVYRIAKYKTSEIYETYIKDQWKILVAYFVLVLAYLFLLDKIGYIFDTVLFGIVSLIMLKTKNKVVVVLLPVILTLVIYYVFSLFLSVILPRGSWISLNL
ncbi:tripartite tricarboxylate transporter TctB family protein [Ruminococcus sp. CLA-AA-H200]|uniref:Tripartite tricarboxylate transporter TctB family protein n=1 Tax=Ruminococcus turbiniformis TaxID=2881258 RepID=A0ABS8G1P9_9FIRM|nr:tripartite tricarboxylate transporter TctB family protein [Ruminococcus turbiniformis]MCC2256146.1 tripartite tricarboxylate transporter TctB family protein [Ruminococcus turbiniformis]